jgi:predicted N-formylglutamate amidohydrolase
MRGLKLTPVITCEHAGNTVPQNYAHLFHGKEEILRSHRGWDPGAIHVAELLSKELSAPFYICETTRLLVEPNRSLDSDSLFSEFSQLLSEEQKNLVLQEYYHPHRIAVEEYIRKSSEAILHLSIHTFTPRWNDVERQVDLGLLFDPERTNETAFCDGFRARLKESLPAMNIEFNEPYKGIDDGFTTYLRTQFDNDRYLGIEIEINQKYVNTDTLDGIAKALLANVILKLQV